MKQIILKGLLVFGVIAFLTGCGEEAKTVNYYKSNIEEAKAKLQECNKMETVNETKELDCQNAQSAIDATRTTGNIYEKSNYKMSDFAKLPGATTNSSK